MGNLVWHEYARLISITATVYTVWAGFWGLMYRKFFWDFVGGTLRDPGGLQPAPSAAAFIAVIVKVPLIQSFSILLGLGVLAIEYPIPQIKSTTIYRSLVLRVVLLIFQAFLAILFYQGTNGTIWSIIAAICYTRAIVLGEKMEAAKENRGKDERA